MLDSASLKTVLTPRLKNRNGRRISQVQRTATRLHRNLHAFGHVRVLLNLSGQTHRLRTKHEHVTGTVLNIRIRRRSGRRERKNTLRSQSLPRILKGLMHRHHRQVVIIQTRAAQMRIIKVKAQRLHQVQLSASNRRQTDSIAGIARNLRGIEKNLEHVPKCTAQPPTSIERPGAVALADPVAGEHT